MEFYVNNSRWILEFVPPNDKNLINSLGVYTLGVADNNLKTVFVNDRLSDTMLDRVVCHELCHVFSFENNLDIAIEVEEIIANFLSLYGRDIVRLADRIIGSVLYRVA